MNAADKSSRVEVGVMIVEPFLVLLVSRFCLAGISIPRDECRWISAPDWHYELKCDGNEVAVGACSGGKNMDCPGNSGFQLQCCAIPEYYYSGCDVFGAGHGVNNDCQDHGALIMEGTCASGEHLTVVDFLP